MSEPRGCVFNIQRYSIHDGPGIRTLVYLKGCPLQCVWCSNPESQSEAPEIGWYAARCLGCGTCVEVCPEGCVSRSPEGVRVDAARCTLCGRCVEACPADALVLFGRWMGVGEVVEEVLRDVAFYQEEGGITLTGGEPCLQAAFAAALLESCRARGLATAVESAGCVEWDSLDPILRHTDTLLFDLKHMDPESHRRMTGRGNELILENLLRADRTGTSIRIRYPLIPGFNDGPENIRSLVRFCRKLRSLRGIDVLPYHRLGTNKYPVLSRPYLLEETRVPSEEQVRAVRAWMKETGCAVSVGG